MGNQGNKGKSKKQDKFEKDEKKEQQKKRADGSDMEEKQMNIFNKLKIKMMIGQILLALVLMVCVRVHILIKH